MTGLSCRKDEFVTASRILCRVWWSFEVVLVFFPHNAQHLIILSFLGVKISFSSFFMIFITGSSQETVELMFVIFTVKVNILPSLDTH